MSLVCIAGIYVGLAYFEYRQSAFCDRVENTLRVIDMTTLDITDQICIDGAGHQMVASGSQ